MNKLIAAALIIGLNLILSQFLPWWNIIPVVMLVVVIMKLRASASFYIPALSLMLLWIIQILILDQRTGFRSSSRIAAIFEAPNFIAYLVPVLGVGLLAGMSGYIACLLASSFSSKKEKLKSDMSLDEYKDTIPDLKDKGIV